jgi:hypothetical protein
VTEALEEEEATRVSLLFERSTASAEHGVDL